MQLYRNGLCSGLHDLLHALRAVAASNANTVAEQVLAQESAQKREAEAKTAVRKETKQARRQKEKASKKMASIANVSAGIIGQVMDDAIEAVDQTEKANERIRAATVIADTNGEMWRVRRTIELHGAHASEAVVKEARVMLRAALHPPVVDCVELWDEDVTEADVVVPGVLVEV
eukprot:2411-Prymnesium_polylepis.1